MPLLMTLLHLYGRLVARWPAPANRPVLPSRTV